MSDQPDRYALRAPARLTPERVRGMVFTRTAIGRRGVSEDEVDAFQRRVAEEITARDEAEASLRAEVAFYKDRLMQWQAERRTTPGEASPGSAGSVAAGQPPVPVGSPGPSIEAVNILSAAQQQADAYVAQARDHCRRMTAEARSYADAMLHDAQQQAEAASERAVHDYRARSGDTYAAELEELERRLVWTRTFLTSIESVETQLRSAREALTFELDKLAARPAPAADPPPPSPSPMSAPPTSLPGPSPSPSAGSPGSAPPGSAPPPSPGSVLPGSVPPASLTGSSSPVDAPAPPGPSPSSGAPAPVTDRAAATPIPLAAPGRAGGLPPARGDGGRS